MMAVSACIYRCHTQKIHAVPVNPQTADSIRDVLSGMRAMQSLAGSHSCGWTPDTWEGGCGSDISDRNRASGRLPAWCRVRGDGYEALPSTSMEVEDAKKAATEQAAREDKYERMLMDVYNALYKVMTWGCTCEDHRNVFPQALTAGLADCHLCCRAAALRSAHETRWP